MAEPTPPAPITKQSGTGEIEALAFGAARKADPVEQVAVKRPIHSPQDRIARARDLNRDAYLVEQRDRRDPCAASSPSAPWMLLRRNSGRRNAG